MAGFLLIGPTAARRSRRAASGRGRVLSTAAVVGVLAALGAAVSAHAGPAPPMGQSHLHGLDNVGGQLGTAASHGCVRLADSTVAWLAARIGPGVPVTIL